MNVISPFLLREMQFTFLRGTSVVTFLGYFRSCFRAPRTVFSEQKRSARSAAAGCEVMCVDIQMLALFSRMKFHFSSSPVKKVPRSSFLTGIRFLDSA